jgi:hypothetical protein
MPPRRRGRGPIACGKRAAGQNAKLFFSLPSQRLGNVAYHAQALFVAFGVPTSPSTRCRLSARSSTAAEVIQ